MGHNHQHHGHSHAPMSAANYNWTFAIASGLNLLFVCAQVVAALIAGSMGLLADAIHNLSDVLGLALAWFASFAV